MPRVRMLFETTPERAFEVLSQPRRYAAWVPGVRAIGEHDERWPAPGATLEHTDGVWPLLLHDTTTVVASDPPRRIELESRSRPLLVARVVLELEPADGGTWVSMDERPVGGLLGTPLRLPPWPLVVWLRNAEALRRLRKVAERT